MPEKKVPTEGLEKLKSFQVTEPTGLTDLPDLPDPEDPDYQPGEVGTGIRIARAVSVLLAGASDPNLAAALAQTFQRQDLIAREDAQNRYKLALGRVQGEREEIAFQKEERKGLVAEQIGAAQIQQNAWDASIRALYQEWQMTEDPAKKTQFPVTLAKMQAYRDAIDPEPPKPQQAKSVQELIGRGVNPNEVVKAMTEGTGEQLLAGFNAKLAAQAIHPKTLIPRSVIEFFKANTDEMDKLLVDTIFATVPDPRTDTFGSQADSLVHANAVRGLAEVNPELADKVAEEVGKAWLETGRVSDLKTAGEIYADYISNNMDPEKNPKLEPKGTYKYPPPEFGERLKRLNQKLSISEETTKKVKKFTEVQGKQQFRR